MARKKAAVEPVLESKDPARREFVKAFQSLCGRWNAWDVWSDWLVMASSAIYNAIHHDEAVEAEYMQAAKKYSPEELNTMSRMLGITVEALEFEVHDFLGAIFHELEMHNEARGQFFTPFEICRLMAVTMQPATPRPGRLLKVHEPACGSGAMVLAFHAELTKTDPDIQPRVVYSLVDLDDRAFRMAYIQCALCGLSAEVTRGDTLAMTFDRTWRTPGYYLHNTATRLRVDQMMQVLGGDGAPTEPVEAAEPVADVPIHYTDPEPVDEAPEPAITDVPLVPDVILPPPGSQLSLF